MKERLLVGHVVVVSAVGGEDIVGGGGRKLQGFSRTKCCLYVCKRVSCRCACYSYAVVIDACDGVYAILSCEALRELRRVEWVVDRLSTEQYLPPAQSRHTEGSHAPHLAPSSFLPHDPKMQHGASCSPSGVQS